jgi:hypothetical protein
MAKENISLSFGIQGMERQNFSHLVDEKTFLFQRNGNIETDDESIALTNEHSNYLCSKFKPGYIVVGHKYDSINSKVWYFITEKNPSITGKRKSEIGFIKINSTVTDLTDFEVECGCDIESILSTPLEDLENITPHCTYTTLISDECNTCLNFDPNFPVHTIVLKQEACGFTITFATKNNPLRYIIVDKIDYYKYTGDINCGVDNTVPTCLDCDKLRVFPLYEKPYIYPEVIAYGGSLKRGTYEFYVAYCDKLGNELSTYLSATNQIDIFDPENIELNQTTQYDRTTYAIKLKVENVDKRFNFYKVAVVEKTDVTESVSAFIEGIHSTADTNIIYTSNGSQNDQRIDLQSIFAEKPFYKNFGGILETNGYLMGYDYEVEKEWNLQPMVSLLGTFVKWQTVEANENLYQDGVNISNFKGYMRDEPYPLGLAFVTNTGWKTATFPFVARPPMTTDLTIYNENSNTDIKSLSENAPNCSTNERKYNWQYYNTGKILGDSFSPIIYPNGIPVDVVVTEDCIQQNVNSLVNGTLTFSLDDPYYGLQDWVSTHYNEICNPSSPYYNVQLCNLITDTTSIPCNFADIFPFPICDTGGCDVGTCSMPQFIESKLYIAEVINEVTTSKPKRYPFDPDNGVPTYVHDQPSANCNQYYPNYPDVVYNVKIFDGFSADLPMIDLKQRLQIWDNTTCASASAIPSPSQFFDVNYAGYLTSLTIKSGNLSPQSKIYRIDNNESTPVEVSTAPNMSVMRAGLLTNILAPAYAGFEGHIHKDALWYEVDFSAASEYLLEITPIKNIREDVGTLTNDQVRFTVFGDCNSYQILTSNVYNSTDGHWKLLKKSDFGNRSRVFICLDTKLVEKTLTRSNADIDSGNYTTSHTYQTVMTTGLPGCFDVKYRPVEYYEIEVTFDLATVNKASTYQSTCKYNKPSDSDCGGVPHKYGYFAYWESTETYPDNADLYDSSKFRIKSSVLNHEDTELMNIFTQYYSSGLNGQGEFVWKEVNGKSLANFTCEPIRHPKFPDNNIIPFMSTIPLTEFSISRIYPIGVTISEKTIEAFLDAAVVSGLIDQEQRDSIIGYEIYRGDRTTNRSIVYKGILNDMYEDPYQTDSKQRTFFRNFPYNTLGRNAFLTSDSDRNNLIDHPYQSNKNDRFSLIAPEVYHGRMRIPTEMSIDGYVYGSALSTFVEAKDHSQWVLLGEKAYDKAEKLASAEVILEAALNLATMIINTSGQAWFLVGFAGGTNAIGVAIGVVAMAAYIAVEIIQAEKFKKPKYKAQWLEIFDLRGNVFNFASMQVSSKGHYNYFKPNSQRGDMLRGIATGKYLNNGMEALTEKEGTSAKTVVINNKDRENSVYLYTGSEYPIQYPQEYINYDNYNTAPKNASRYIASDDNCNSITNSVKRIASPYVTLKNYVPDQYGKIDEIKWLSINHNSRFNNDSKNIFGGDIFISRVDLKNKFKMFNENAIKLGDRVPFKYSNVSNVGYTRFYVDHKSATVDLGSNDIPFISSTYNLDCKGNQRNFYEGSPSKFYVFSYGIPYFLVESEINSNFRYAGKEPHEQFASRGVNVEEWVQERMVSIAQNNIFYYNSIYSRNQTGLPYRTLPAFYDKKTYDCLSIAENGVAWSEQDNSEVSLSDPWLVFKPYNIYRFPFSFGKLISLNAIESTQVIGRFSDNMAVFNAVDVLRDRLTPENKALGSGGIFATRPVQYSFTELGETGSQSRAFVSCEFGHYWVDAKRGKVFQLEPNAKGLNAISDFKKSGQESGMRKWFKRHLPFKILKQNIEGLSDKNLDNTYKGLGILMWWDSRFKRVFITKLDYTVKAKYKDQIVFNGGNFYLGTNTTPLELSNKEYFKDVSWTIAYSPMYDSWISYYDFKPNYAIAFNDYFQTGLNYSSDPKEEGLWSHLLTNKSYQVFYGKYYPWQIELPVKNTYTNNVLQDLKIWTISKRYHDNFDYAVWRKKSFNKLVVYNQTNNSGLLHLNYDDGYKKSKYPFNVSSTEQGIMATHFDEQLWINYFYNRVKKEEAHLPIWNWDNNEIDKQLNPKTISFNSKRILERMRGDWFIVRLTQDNTSQFKHYFKWMVSKEQGY